MILEKRFADVTGRYGIMEGYIRGREIAFPIKEYFEAGMVCSIYDVLPDAGKTSLLTPKPWRPGKYVISSVATAGCGISSPV